MEEDNFLRNIQRHYRRLKRKRTSSRAASLAWMEQEGLTPVKVIAKNTRTDELETIVLMIQIYVRKMEGRSGPMCTLGQDDTHQPGRGGS